jgi:hypothetical protein
MTQHDMVIANADGATVRADINAALLALAGVSSGTSAPSTTYAYMFWADTTNGLLKQRNAANSGWLVRGTLAESFLVAKSATFSVGVGDLGRVMVVDATSAAITANLPTAATAGDGFEVTIVKVDASANAVTLDGSSSETINGATTFTLTARYDGVRVRSNGTAWYVVGWYSAKTIRRDQTAVLSAGMTTGSYNLGNLNSATTLSIADGAIQHGTVTGTFTLTAPDDSDEGGMEVELTIDATGGYTVTLSGFTTISGTVDTTANAVNYLRIVKHNTNTTLEIVQAS